MKRDLKYFWFHYGVNDDMYNCYNYVNPLSKTAAQEIYSKELKEVEELELLLSEPYAT